MQCIVKFIKPYSALCSFANSRPLGNLIKNKTNSALSLLPQRAILVAFPGSRATRLFLIGLQRPKGLYARQKTIRRRLSAWIQLISPQSDPPGENQSLNAAIGPKTLLSLPRS